MFFSFPASPLGYYRQTVSFYFIEPEDISPKSKFFVSMHTYKLLSGFLWWYWSSGFFIAEQPVRLGQYRTCFTMDIDTCLPGSLSILIGSFAVILGLTCNFPPKFIHLHETECILFLSSMAAVWFHRVSTS